MRKSAKAKLRDARGLSLTELLLTMLILLLASEIVTDGIPAVIRAYERTVDTANAEIYLNTVTIALRNTLSFASNPTEKDEDGGKVVYYTDPKIGRCKISNSDNGIQIQEGVDMVTLPPLKLLAPNEKKPLEWYIENKQRKAEFVSSYGEIKCDGDFFQITELTVKKDGEELAKLDSPYFIRKLNP